MSPWEKILLVMLIAAKDLGPALVHTSQGAIVLNASTAFATEAASALMPTTTTP